MPARVAAPANGDDVREPEASHLVAEGVDERRAAQAASRVAGGVRAHEDVRAAKRFARGGGWVRVAGDDDVADEGGDGVGGGGEVWAEAVASHLGEHEDVAGGVAGVGSGAVLAEVELDLASLGRAGRELMDPALERASRLAERLVERRRGVAFHLELLLGPARGVAVHQEGVGVVVLHGAHERLGEDLLAVETRVRVGRRVRIHGHGARGGSTRTATGVSARRSRDDTLRDAVDQHAARRHV